jgi:hypothetical protein
MARKGHKDLTSRKSRIRKELRDEWRGQRKAHAIDKAQGADYVLVPVRSHGTTTVWGKPC